MNKNSKKLKNLEYEKNVLELLRFVQAKDKKELHLNILATFEKDIRKSFDANAPSGIAGIEGNVYIEVKNNINSARFTLDTWDKFMNNSDNYKLLIILSSNYGSDSKIINEIRNNKKDIIIWDFEETFNKAKIYNYLPFLDYANKLDESRDFLYHNKEEKNSNYQSQNLLTVLKSIIQDSTSKVMFVFGAGVSSPYKLDKWDELLETLFDSININFKKENVLNFIGQTPLIKAQLLYDLYGAKADYQKIKLVKKIQESFYKKFIDTKDITILKSFAKYINSKENIDVMTYNYDDILEYEIEDKESFQVIDRLTKIKDKRIRIYHPHGFLPRDQIVDIEMANNIILSENNYNSLYNNPYTWSNVIQLNNFRENVCIFIGISLTDPSIRRLLELSVTGEEVNSHFAFFCKDKLLDEEIIEVDNHFLRLNIKIIWINEYSEISDFIDSLSH